MVSVVVPCEPGGDPSACLRALESLPAEERARILEVFVAWGRNPSRQRNEAVAGAQAPLVLFLDSDSRVQAGLLPGLMEALEDPKTAAAGGPNLPLLEEGALGLRFDAVLASYAGSMASRARYCAQGDRRPCTEKELILCNLMVRREAFVGEGGFREDLYPNEENELFNRLQAGGWRLMYVPEAQVRRPRRHSVGAFALQSFRYGRGRTQQMRRNFFPSDLVNLLPLALPLTWIACLALAAVDGPWSTWIKLPVLAYAAACFVASGIRPSVALFLMLRHHAYAFGLVAGLFQDPGMRPSEVRVERVAWDPTGEPGPA